MAPIMEFTKSNIQSSKKKVISPVSLSQSHCRLHGPLICAIVIFAVSPGWLSGECVGLVTL